MLRALYSSAAGMHSQQTNLDVISNNLANVNTTGFKKDKAEFADLLYDTTRTPGADQSNGAYLPTGVQIGHGSRLVATSKVFTEGELSYTGERMDLAIKGDGFFEVQLPDGTSAFTRDGALKTDSSGNVVTNEGLKVLGGFAAIPQGTTNITVSSTGEFTVEGSSGESTFRVQLARFNNASGLQSLGGNLFKETTASGQPQRAYPGESGVGSVEQY
jgi:flagellar basal-body rod protein FlgG